MTLEEKLAQMKVMLGDIEEDDILLLTYLDIARQRILNHRFPFGTKLVDVEPQYEHLQIELAIALYNQRGAEGQERHSENGVTRTWRTVVEILSDIPRRGGMPA